ncbi:hypothetical protein [Solibacillus isronensis]|uniref:hypothetical protein n=1 Tax=Solibacillus isronensis TaxID=412383 RepID=UPI0009A67538|nr:hypothetical protein [Solibacillus isronensis]
MNIERTKLVHCGAITYVYNYESSENIKSFSFEDEFLQLQRSLAINFIDDYAVIGFTLSINTNDVSSLQTRLDNFLSNIAKRGLKYIAVLDIAKKHPCVHLITNKTAKLTDEQLTSIWGNKVIRGYISYDELLIRYATAARKSQMLTPQYLFTSDKLKKPRTFHNDAADVFFYEREIMDVGTCDVYEISDSQHGIITVSEYMGIPY